MAQIEFVQSGEINILDIVRTDWNASSNVQMKLFTATTASDHNPSLANFTEASFTGYSAVTLANWSAATHPDSSQHAVTDQQTDAAFSNSSGSAQNVKGIYLEDSSAVELLGWGYFVSGGTDITINDGSTLTVPITVMLKTTFEHSFS